MTGYSIMGFVDPPGRIVAGAIRYRGQNLVEATAAQWRRLRGVRIAMVFQDPMMPLNPVLRIDTQLTETLGAHGVKDRREAWRRARDALGQVGIPDPEARLLAYPHQLSGGMRQRIAIAIALLHRPEVLLADEPTTALDVTIQGQILAEVQGLCRRHGTALLWISHDLAVVAGLADRIAVMYAGKIVEEGSVDDVIDRPLHPYTKGLLASVPGGRSRGEPLTPIPGMTPSLLHLPPGCAFKVRCPRAQERCDTAPPLATFGLRRVRCHFPHLDPVPREA
ncbi:MAG: ABC transporter ATP-binding protein [Candidatus Competibacterales bacterium]